MGPTGLQTVEIASLVGGAVTFLLAVGAVGHALVTKRDPRSATIWLLAILLLPLVGVVLYVLFGINRYRRRAIRIREDHPRLVPAPPPDTATAPAAFAGLDRLAEQTTGLPLVPGNLVTPLVDGAEAYPAMLAAIRQARASVALLSFLFDGTGIGEEFVAALAAAQRRGVAVRVLIDDVHVRLSRRSAFRPLRRAGVPFAAFNATLVPARLHAANLRNHRKILVLDGATGFTGGTNIFAPYWRPEAPGRAFRDLHCRIEGLAVLHLRDCFAQDWADTTGEVLGRGFWRGAPAPVPGGAPARGIAAGPDEALDRMRWLFLGAIATARRSIRIRTPYFVPDQATIAALSAAALRGVAVEIMVPAENDHAFVHWAAQAHFWQVLEHGARVHSRRGPFDHSKLMLVDDAWVCLGSANWDARSLRLNFEFNVEVYDPALSARLAADFDRIRAQECDPVTAETLAARSLPVKLRDGFARLFAPIL
ncbi:MAG: phospholipase D-like domain-containing protein [Tabrizicola flagellatus]|uniref:phospholipase D-like domain-containing protein n=1 Tax=Tabrizicola flagellatus TaxID=2593021 RepID=UPI00391D4B11